MSIDSPSSPMPLTPVNEIDGEEKQIRVKFGKDFRIISYFLWENTLKNLAGKILTIIDASFSEPVQRKAVKDLAKQTFWKAIYDCQRDYYDGNAAHGVNLEARDLDAD